jgi:hypothetical protein
VSCFICVICGVQHAESGLRPPERCAICDDERQYVPEAGQRWIATEELGQGHHNEFRRHEERLVGVSTSPSFAIGQRGLLVLSPQGNVLWDCVSLLDEFTERTIRDLGGIAAIAISHPHYYSALTDWAAAFDAPVYLHAADRRWVMRASPAIVHWDGDELDLHDGMKIVNPGGHFDGGAMLHVPFLAEGHGALLTGDIIQVIPDRTFVSFMYSYPNLIPLGSSAIRRIAAVAAGLEFDRIYGAWWDREISTGAKAVVARSVERYLKHIRQN